MSGKYLLGENKKNESHAKTDHDHGPWYKVMVPDGVKLGKDFIMKSLTTLIRGSFQPYNFQFCKSFAEFYVYGHSVAEQIKKGSERLTTSFGFKLILLVENVDSPIIVIDHDIIAVIQAAMSARYYPEGQYLNLTKFHEMETLKMQCLYVPLNNTAVFREVIKIIKESIPEIEILIICENELDDIEAMSVLVPVCKKLKFVDLCDNKIRAIGELNYLKGLNLEELIIDGNPFCDDYEDKTSYINTVRELFPKLRRLDEYDLYIPMRFGLEIKTLPVVSKKSFFPTNDVKALIVKFLKIYYKVYDTRDRSGLLYAYHDRATLTLNLSVKKTCENILKGDNRKLLKVMDNDERIVFLKEGRLCIINALQELPLSKHILSTFSFRIAFALPYLLGFSVIGKFVEVGPDVDKSSYRIFSRKFVCAPHGTGIMIVRETFFLDWNSKD